MGSVEKLTVTKSADYKTLYYKAFNALTDLHNLIEKAQQDLEQMYLQETEPVELPDYISVAEN